MKSRYNPVLTAVILLGLVCALWVNWHRHEIEQRNNTVEMAMEYENLRKLAALEGLPEATVLQKFRDAGITSLMIFDTTLERLAKNNAVKIVTGGELRLANSLGADKGVFAALKNVQEDAVYIAQGTDATIFAEVQEDLLLRYGKERVALVSSNPPIIEALGSTALVPEDKKHNEPLGILQAPLGLLSSDIKKVADSGFAVIVRPQNYVNVNEAHIDNIFKRIAKSGVEVKAYMPGGREVVGYPDKIAYMAEKLDGRKLMMIEHYTQLRFANVEGLVPLAEAVDYNVARSYVIDGLEQKKISVGEALRRWALTDEERNVRVNYIRPFWIAKNGQDIMTMNLEYVQNIAKNVQARGYKLGEAGVFEKFFPAKINLVLIAAGILAAVVIYLAHFVELSGNRQIILWVVLTAGVSALLFVGSGLAVRQALALAAAVVFPVLSMSVILDMWDKKRGADLNVLQIIFNAVWQLALAVALSLVGGAFLGAILADTRFILEIDIYRGVKLTFLLPLILMAALYIKRYDVLEIKGCGVQAGFAKISSLLNSSLTFKHIAIVGVLVIVLLYFVGRSGHTGGVPVAALEIKLRLWLEQLMYARPRQKEFMIGHPAFFIAAYAAYKGAPKLWQFALCCAAVIGQASLVQTFCHMRTPFLMSFVRAWDGYALGAVIGVVTLAALALVMPYLEKLQRRYLEQ